MVSETTTLTISKNNNKNNTDDVMSETKKQKIRYGWYVVRNLDPIHIP